MEIRSPRKKKTLYSVVLATFLLFAFLLIGVLMVGFFSADISSDLEKNNYRFYFSKIENKALELERSMVSKWSSEELIDPVIDIVRNQYALGNAETPFQFTEESAEALISMISEMNASGAFVIVDRGLSSKPALYFRDHNEFNRQASFNDLAMVMGPAEIAASLGITLQSDWTRDYEKGFGDFASLYDNAMLRYRDTKVKEFWQEITVGGESSILYLNVLTDGDAVPYGLLGVEIRQSLMTRFLTYGDLTASKKSGYAISHWDGSDLYRPIFLNGPYVKSKLGEKPHHFTPIRNSKFVTYSGDLYDDRAYHVDDFVAIALPLRLYEKGSKMQQENQWVMIAYIAKDEFYIYTDRVRNILIIQTISAIVFSIAIASLLSGMLVRPLRTIIQDIQSSELDGELALRNVDVTELDLLIDTIRKLTSNIRSNASRLEHIMQTLRLPILIIEQNIETDKVYKFGSLRPIFDKYADRTKQWPISSALFDEIRRDFMSMVRKVDFEEEGADQQIYEYFGSKEIYFLRYISKRVDNRIYHFVMNYSQEVRNKMRILYERDHDGITSLLNRFAFRERVNQTLVERPARRAAMVMWDLDDLKYVNDTYGHDYGDKYLKYAGTVLSTIQTPETFVSRVSGDEFFAFIPFDAGKERVIEMVQSLRSRMLESRLVIGEYSDIPIRATAGIAWYPEDGSTFEELKRHADFAMYTAKRSEKGSIAEFDMTLYEGDAILITGREQFNAFLEREEADFAFQPIVDLKQGKVFAFEALMRPTSKHITNVFDVMRIAKMQSKLKAIEWMTWNGVLTKAKQNLDVIGDRRIFINSIASVAFDESEIEELESRFGSLLSHLVVEITESERLEYRSIDVQRKLKGRWKTKMAIDDFGTAYSSESMLLEVMPDFVKLDMTLIRNIHEDVSRQKLVANILDYVETRGIKLIAEGVEQLEELRFLKKIGVPYVQGFYLGKPSLYIVDPDPRLLDEIRSM